jgi:hypothetical protein
MTSMIDEENIESEENLVQNPPQTIIHYTLPPELICRQPRYAISLVSRWMINYFSFSSAQNGFSSPVESRRCCIMANSQKLQINTMRRDGKCITVSHRLQHAKICSGKSLQNVPFGHLPWLPYGRNRMAPAGLCKTDEPIQI